LALLGWISLRRVTPGFEVAAITSGALRMKAAQLINDAQHWRDRAQHMRFLAGLVQDAGARRKMLDVAESYERLASRAEKRNPTLVRTKHSAGSLSRA
jgi:hypothetical protein